MNKLINILDIGLNFVFGYLVINAVADGLLNWMGWGLFVVFIVAKWISYYQGGNYVEGLWHRFGNK